MQQGWAELASLQPLSLRWFLPGKVNAAGARRASGTGRAGRRVARHGRGAGADAAPPPPAAGGPGAGGRAERRSGRKGERGTGLGPGPGPFPSRCRLRGGAERAIRAWRSGRPGLRAGVRGAPGARALQWEPGGRRCLQAVGGSPVGAGCGAVRRSPAGCGLRAGVRAAPGLRTVLREQEPGGVWIVDGDPLPGRDLGDVDREPRALQSPSECGLCTRSTG